MIQLILDTEEYNITLPESHKGGYQAEKQSLSVEVEMVSGRIVRELRGNVWHLVYQYGYFDDETKNRVIAACEKGRGQPILCGFLPPTSAGELLYSRFFVMEFTYPTFMWSRMSSLSEEAPIPLWGDFSVELREVEPSD